jgi:hypothetical protein
MRQQYLLPSYDDPIEVGEAETVLGRRGEGEREIR